MAVPPRPHGFTLIELVCVIAVLGILAATAMPRFTDLAKEARIAKINMLVGALHTTAQLWYAVCVLQKDPTCLTGEADISNNGVYADIYRGYPNAGDNRVYQIETLINTNGFTITKPQIFYTKFSIADAPNPSSCAVTYCEYGNKDATYCTPTSYRINIYTDGCG